MANPPKKAISKSRAVTRRLKSKTPRDAKSSLQRPGRFFSLTPTASRQELLDEDGKSDHKFRQFLYDFSVLGSHFESVRAHLASQVGLTSPQYNIAMIIGSYQGDTGVSVSEVAQHLHVSTAFITSEVGKLEKMGLVEKSQNPNDGRGIHLRLTPSCENGLEDIGPQRLLINDHLFRSLSRDDFHHLASILTVLIEDSTDTINMLNAMRKSGSFRKGKLPFSSK